MKDRNKALGIAVMFAVIVLGFTACAHFISREYGDFLWRLEGNHVTITGYNGPGGTVEIPAQINGRPVGFIGAGAFENSNLTSVTIPNSVIVIRTSAFRGNNLTSITIPNSVGVIGDGAFANNQLTSVTIGNSVADIGNAAFANNQLTSVTISNSVTHIRDLAFANNQLTSVTKPASASMWGPNVFRGNPSDITINRVGTAAHGATPAAQTHGVYGNFHWTTAHRRTEHNRRTNELTITGHRRQSETVIIPAVINGRHVRIIGNSAFARSQLTSVTIPDSVTIIEYTAFARNQLTSVTIPNSVTTIGRWAFENNQLTSVTIPNSVRYIGIYAFLNNQLTSVVILDGVTSIRDGAFLNNQLTNITIPNSVSHIGSRAFAGNQLTRVTIGGNVGIAYNAFPGGLAAAYEVTGRTAGTFTRPNITSTNWTWQP